MEELPDLYGLKDKVIIVTGTSSGIGLSTALLLLRCGANILGVDVNAPPAALQSTSTIDRYKHHIADLLDRSSPAAIVAACIKIYGPKIDGLVNNAGIADHMCSADTLTDEDWDRVMGINLTAPVALMRAVLPHMLSGPSDGSGGQRNRRGGSIINVASTAAFCGACSGIAYAASKHGLAGASKNVAWRFKEHGVRCNVVCPGPTDTNISTSTNFGRLDLEAARTFEPVWNVHGIRIPGISKVEEGGKQGGSKVMEPEKVAQMLVWLCSGLSEGVNGAILPVDGGICAVGC